MVRKKGVIFSLILLSSGIVYSDCGSSDVFPLVSEANFLESNDSANKLGPENTENSTGTSSSDSESSHVLGFELKEIKNPGIRDLDAILSALSPEEKACVREQLMAAQLQNIAQHIVEELANNKEWSEGSTRYVRKELSSIAGENDRKAAIEAILEALQEEIRGVNTRLGEKLRLTDGERNDLRDKFDNLREAEKGFNNAARRIIDYASEADAEFAASWVPGSPRIKRYIMNTGIGLTIIFGSLLWFKVIKK